jgi:hypothetical protein
LSRVALLFPRLFPGRETGAASRFNLAVFAAPTDIQEIGGI